jgi:hypothetical protein
MPRNNFKFENMLSKHNIDFAFSAALSLSKMFQTSIHVSDLKVPSLGAMFLLIEQPYVSLCFVFKDWFARIRIMPNPKLPSPISRFPNCRHMKTIVIASRIMLLIYEGKL